MIKSNTGNNDLALLLKDNLILNTFGNTAKSYTIQTKKSDFLYADPIGMMCVERIKNVGELEALDETCFESEDVEELAMLNSFTFPTEYEYLLSLDAINEQTLRPNKKLWKTIMDKPRHTKAVIEKEIALICLNWAQSKLDEKVPVIEYALLKYSKQEVMKGQFGKMIVVSLELLSPKERGDDALIAKQVRKGAIVKFGSKRTGEMLDIPWAKVKAAKNRFILLEVYVYNIKNPKSKELVDSMTLLDNEEVIVYEMQPDFIPQSMLRSIERIKTGILDHFVSPELTYEPEKIFKSSLKRIQPTLKAYTGLNSRQCQVLYSICTKSHKDAPYILNGPPGTGKTRTIAATVRCLLEMDPRIRILLTAPSNMAVDMIAHKVMDQFDRDTMNASNVLRLKSIGQDYFGRDKRLDPISSFDAAAQLFVIPKQKDFLRYRVVLSTLGCSTHLINRQIPPGFFTHIFLDEAGQANESEIWIPLGGLATKDTSVIICGDPKQLGPVITLTLPNSVTSRFDSALIRYIQMDNYGFDERMYCQLTRSYRCHSTILDIASQLFYEQSLRSAIYYRDEPFSEWEALPKKGFPVLFVNVDGSQFTEGKGKSYANQKEILVTLAYIRQLLANFELNPADIGVISPYRLQTNLLTKDLEKAKIPNSRLITVDSVERFQGSERKVIIITATRSNGLGFVGCPLRLNTSITRAMNLLIVIGNKDALSSHGSWKQFLEYCETNESLIDWGGEIQLFR